MLARFPFGALTGADVPAELVLCGHDAVTWSFAASHFVTEVIAADTYQYMTQTAAKVGAATYEGQKPTDTD